MRRIEHSAGFSAVEGLLILVVVSIVGFTGWYVWHAMQNADKINNSSTQDANSSAKFVKRTKPAAKPATPVNPYGDWKPYTSSTEKLTFKYPPDWIATPSNDSTQVEGADSLSLKSPSGAVTVQWFSSVEGIGGACSVYVLPGATPKPDDLGPCPYFYVLDKQKLAGADLYYVDGVMEQSDGKAYTPWCGLQGPDGIVQSESKIFYMLFTAKNTFAGTNDANRGGPYQAELACGSGFGGTVGSSGTKAQATAFLSTPEMQQAKLILLSATY